MEYRSHKIALSRFAFVAMYAPVLLSYPVTDKRFLFPAPSHFHFVGSAGNNDVAQKSGTWRRWVLVVSTVLCLFRTSHGHTTMVKRNTR